MKRFRAAVVGLSWISTDEAGAASHPVLGTAVPYSHLSAMAAVPAVEVVAGCDIVPAAGEAFLQRWRSRWPNITAYTDFRDMLDRESVDLLCVATPDHLHREVVLHAVRTGVKMIFCEKPLAISLEDADVMIRAVNEHGVLMSINHTRRWMPDFVTAREQVRRGGIGKVSQIIVRSGGPRAMLFRNHTHSIDLVCYFADSEPEWVAAELEAGFSDYGTSYRGDGGRDPATEPGANAYIVFRNGIRAFFSGLKSNVDGLYVQVIGSAGHLEISPFGVSLTTQTEKGLATQAIRPVWTRAGMQAAIEELIDASESGKPMQSSPEEARKAVSIITAILESQAGGNVPVRVR